MKMRTSKKQTGQTTGKRSLAILTKYHTTHWEGGLVYENDS
nr:hypothetical protein [Brevibacillus laterosporus]